MDTIVELVAQCDTVCCIGGVTPFLADLFGRLNWFSLCRTTHVERCNSWSPLQILIGRQSFATMPNPIVCNSSLHISEVGPVDDHQPLAVSCFGDSQIHVAHEHVGRDAPSTANPLLPSTLVREHVACVAWGHCTEGGRPTIFFSLHGMLLRSKRKETSSFCVRQQQGFRAWNGLCQNLLTDNWVVDNGLWCCKFVDISWKQKFTWICNVRKKWRLRTTFQCTTFLMCQRNLVNAFERLIDFEKLLQQRKCHLFFFFQRGSIEWDVAQASPPEIVSWGVSAVRGVGFAQEDDKGIVHDVHQGEGGEQGDVLMPALFALGQHEGFVAQCMINWCSFSTVSECQSTRCCSVNCGFIPGSWCIRARRSCGTVEPRRWELLAVNWSDPDVVWRGDPSLPGIPLGSPAMLERFSASHHRVVDMIPHITDLCCSPFGWCCAYIFKVVHPPATPAFAVFHDVSMRRCMEILLDEHHQPHVFSVAHGWSGCQECCWQMGNVNLLGDGTWRSKAWLATTQGTISQCWHPCGLDSRSFRKEGLLCLSVVAPLQLFRVFFFPQQCLNACWPPPCSMPDVGSLYFGECSGSCVLRSWWPCSSERRQWSAKEADVCGLSLFHGAQFGVDTVPPCVNGQHGVFGWLSLPGGWSEECRRLLANVKVCSEPESCGPGGVSFLLAPLHVWLLCLLEWRGGMGSRWSDIVDDVVLEARFSALWCEVHEMVLCV